MTRDFNGEETIEKPFMALQKDETQPGGVRSKYLSLIKG